jgi:hypothetical protein
MLIHSTSASLSRPSASSGAVLRAARFQPCLGVDPPKPRVNAVRIVDMSTSNAWAEFASLYRLTRPAALDHDRAKTELKALVPDDAREALGHGLRAKRSKSGAISLELLAEEVTRAAL